MVLAAPIAEVVVYPRLVVPGNIGATVQNMLAGRGLFLAGLFCYLITFICDVVVAWALFVLMAPTNRPVSLLAAWFRLLHAVIALVGLLKLVTVFRFLNTPDYVGLVGTDRLHAQVLLLLSGFRYDYGFSLIFFAIHLGLLGWLVYRSGYIPGILGVLLAVAGVGHLAYTLGPYLYPGADVRFLMFTFLGDLVFMLWLLARGHRIQE